MEHQRKDANIIFASLFIQTAGCEQTEYWKNKIHIEDVWKETYGNENIIVGIIDSGIDLLLYRAIDKTPKTQTIVMSFFLKIDISIKIVKNI